MWWELIPGHGDTATILHVDSGSLIQGNVQVVVIFFYICDQLGIFDSD